MLHASMLAIRQHLYKLNQIKPNHIYWHMAALRLDYTITQSRRTQVTQSIVTDSC